MQEGQDIKNPTKKGIALATLLVAPLAAQFLLQKQKSDISPRATKTGNGHEWIIVPVQGNDIDQYNFTPISSGVLQLAGFTGAYAIAKRRKK